MTDVVLFLEWDSTFFAKNIASVITPAELTKKETELFDLLVCKVESHNFKAFDQLANLGFSFVESEIEFSLQLNEKKVNKKSLTKYVAVLNDIEELKNIAKYSFASSRFREPWFSSGQNQLFYQKWVENAVLSIFDDVCLIDKIDGFITGFVTLKVNKNYCYISLLSVHTAYRQQGVAKRLISLAKNYAIQHHCDTLVVVTQGSNISAINLYFRADFNITSTNYWFYKGNK